GPTLRVEMLTPYQTGWSASPLSQSSFKLLARGLADAFVAGPWTVDELVERGGRALGRRWRWLRPLVRRLRAAFDCGTRPAALRVAAFLGEDEGLRKAYHRHTVTLAPAPRLPAAMVPASGAPLQWRVPQITTARALAAGFGLTPAELEWFA